MCTTSGDSDVIAIVVIMSACKVHVHIVHVWVHIMEPIRQFEATLVPSSVPLSASVCVCVCVCGRGQRGRIGLQTERKRAML